MTTPNTPDQRIDNLLDDFALDYESRYIEIDSKAQRGLITAKQMIEQKQEAYRTALDEHAAQLKSLVETMMAEVVGDTPIPSEDEMWRYTDEGVGKFIQLNDQRQRIPQVISKYFGASK